MKITSIERQKHRNNRYSIFVDKEFSFGLSEKVLSQLQLNIGTSLNPAELVNISEMEDVEKAFQFAIRYHSIRPRSSSEFKVYLTKKKFSEAVINSAMEKLNSLSVINDKEFARMFVSDKLKLRPVSRIMMEILLSKKGIKKELAQSILNKYYTVDSEKKVAAELAKKRIERYIKNKFTEVDLKKVFDFLLRRGFSYSIVTDVLKNIYKTNLI